MTTERIANLCQAAPDALLSHFRMGFELETQATLGKRAGDLYNHLDRECVTQLDNEAYQAALAAKIALFEALPPAEQLSYFVMGYGDETAFSWATLNFPKWPAVIDFARNSGRRGSWDRCKKLFIELGIQDAELIANLKRQPPQTTAQRAAGATTLYNGAIWDMLANGHIGGPWYVDKNQYYKDGFRDLSREQLYVCQLLGMGAHEVLSMSQDGSVAGIELKTHDEGVDYPTFMAAAERAMSVQHTIDSRCSFHIHLSVPEVKHKYGRKFQRECIAYLVAHRDELPESVKSRFASPDWMSRYYSARLDEDKYRLVAFREYTWEFRGFGNVKTKADADTCVQLACRAMQHAYQVTTADAPALFPAIQMEQFAMFVVDCLSFRTADPAAWSTAPAASVAQGDLIFEVVGNAVVVRPSTT
jgi:hypothetical protein